MSLLISISDYEAVANECRIYLFKLHLQEKELELKYNEKGGINGGSENYECRKLEKLKLEKNSKSRYHRSLFLESWSKGDFSSCDEYFNKFNNPLTQTSKKNL